MADVNNILNNLVKKGVSSTNYGHRTDQSLISKSSDLAEALDLTLRPSINPVIGGQHGFANNTFLYVSEHPYVQQQAYCNLLSTPSELNTLPGGEALHGIFRAFFENRSRTFGGLTEKTEYHFAEQQWSGKTMSVISGSSRSLGAVNHELVDVKGEIFYKAFRAYGDNLLNDPDLMLPRVIIYPNHGDLIIDTVSFSAIYWEPTDTWDDVAHAALVVGMMPKELPQIEIRRDKTADGAMREFSMEFTGLIDFDTLAAKQIGRFYMQKMPLFNPNGRSAPAGFLEVSSDLANSTNSGTINQMTEERARVTNPQYIL